MCPYAYYMLAGSESLRYAEGLERLVGTIAHIIAIGCNLIVGNAAVGYVLMTCSGGAEHIEPAVATVGEIDGYAIFACLRYVQHIIEVASVPFISSIAGAVVTAVMQVCTCAIAIGMELNVVGQSECRQVVGLALNGL